LAIYENLACLLILLSLTNSCKASGESVPDFQSTLTETHGLEIEEDSAHLLRMACLKGDMESVKRLLKDGANVDELCKGCSPLMAASVNGHVEIMSLLLDKGATVNLVDNEGETALGYAAMGGHVKALKLLLTKGADLNHRNKYGEGALTAALDSSGHPQPEAAKYLLEQGEKPGPIDLFCVPRTGDLTIVRMVYEQGDFHKLAELEERMGYSVLSRLQGPDDVEILEFLAQMGANLNQPNSEGQTILMFMTSYPDRLSMALKLGADVNCRDLEGRSLLFYLFDPDYTPDDEFDRSCRILLEHGMDTNSVDSRGISAVEFAKRIGQDERIRRFTHLSGIRQ